MLPRYAHLTNTWGNKQDDPISLAGRPQRCIGFFQTPTANTCDARRYLFTPLGSSCAEPKVVVTDLSVKMVFPTAFQYVAKETLFRALRAWRGGRWDP